MDSYFTERTSISLVSELAMELLVLENDLNCIETPYRFTFNNVEIAVMVLSHPIPNIHVIGIYRSKTYVTISQLINCPHTSS